MTTSGSLTKAQVYSRSGSLSSENFETLWKTIKDYMHTLPDNSLLVRGPNFGRNVFGDNPTFTRELMGYFMRENFGNTYWAAGSGTELTYPADEKEIIAFFRIVVVTLGGSVRQTKKRFNQKRSQRARNRETQQAMDTQVQAPIPTNPPNPPRQNIHSLYITNPDEEDDKVFEAGLNGEEPKKFLVSPLSIRFDEFFSRFCECWSLDPNTVDSDNLTIKVFVVDVGEYILHPSNFSSDWKKTMKIAESAPDSRIQVSINIHGYIN